jgi:hypothetical protein
MCSWIQNWNFKTKYRRKTKNNQRNGLLWFALWLWVFCSHFHSRLLPSYCRASHVLIFSSSHPLILSFSHSLILSFSHSHPLSLTLSFSHSLILSSSHSLILSVSHSLNFFHSRIQLQIEACLFIVAYFECEQLMFVWLFLIGYDRDTTTLGYGPLSILHIECIASVSSLCSYSGSSSLPLFSSFEFNSNRTMNQYNTICASFFQSLNNLITIWIWID